METCTCIYEQEKCVARVLFTEQLHVGVYAILLTYNNKRLHSRHGHDVTLQELISEIGIFGSFIGYD